jgi:hypothetical protein
MRYAKKVVTQLLEAEEDYFEEEEQREDEEFAESVLMLERQGRIRYEDETREKT